MEGAILAKTMCTVETARVAAGLPPHLACTLTAMPSRIDHSLTRQLTSNISMPRLHEILLRSKFGAVEGCPPQRGHASGTPFPCPLCGHAITNGDVSGRLHGAQWTNHGLHECTHPKFESARTRVQSTLTEWWNGYDDSLTPVIWSVDQVWDDDAVLPVDLRGYVHAGTRDLLLSVGLSLSDMTDMFQTIALEIRDMITLLDCKLTTFQVGSAEE